MSRWDLVALGDIFEIARGGSPRPIDDYITDDPDGINWIMIGDASEESKYISRAKKRIRQEGVRRSRMVHPGDFLLTNSMSFGKPYILRTSGCIHDGWLVLSKKVEEIDSDFFYHLLRSQVIYTEFARLAAGATVKNLNIELVSRVKVRLPPLSEQRRIAEVLDRAEALRAKRRGALAEFDGLTRAVFSEMFGDPANNHHRWLVAKLGDVARTTSGGTPGRGVPEYFGGPIPWVKSGELHQETVTITEETLTVRGVAESSAKVMPPGTVLVAMYGATVGAVATLGIAAATNQAVCCIQPSRELEPVYLVHLLKHLTPSLLAKRVGGAQPNLSQELLRNMHIVVPPHDAQHEFSKRIRAINRLKASQRASLAEMDSLFASLQHRAFRGEL
jgi:type I restriction enzyme S subunit